MVIDKMTYGLVYRQSRVLDEAAIITLGQRFKDWGDRIEDVSVIICHFTLRLRPHVIICFFAVNALFQASKFVEDSAVELFEHNL